MRMMFGLEKSKSADIGGGRVKTVKDVEVSCSHSSSIFKHAVIYFIKFERRIFQLVKEYYRL